MDEQLTPLDAARKLAQHDPRNTEGAFTTTCIYCSAWSDHAPTCPWLALPRIVAAIAAAEAVARAYDEETVETLGAARGFPLNLGSPLIRAVDTLDKVLKA